MPIYVRKCTACGRIEERIAPVAERHAIAPCEATIAETADGPIACVGVLEREGPEGHGETRENWMKWWRGFRSGQKFA